MQSQKNFSRDWADFSKFLFWVTTPTLVTVLLMGICQIQLFLIGRK